VAPTRWTTATVSDAAFADALAVFRRLRRPADPGDTGRAVFSPDGQASFGTWFDANVDRMGGESAAVAGVDSKLPGQAARLALVLHCLWNHDDPRVMVSRERVEDGIDLAEYFRAHALRVLCHFGVSAAPAFAGLPARVLRALERAGDDPASPDRWVSRTRLHRGLGNGVKAPELDAALAALEAAGRTERGELATATNRAEAWRVVCIPAESMKDYEESPAGTGGRGGNHS